MMNPSKTDLNNAEEENLAPNSDKKQKSLPKFNRKGDARLLEKKRSIDITSNQHKISYISPGKNIGTSNAKSNASVIESPTFQNVMHKFSVTSDELFKCQKNTSFNEDYGLIVCEKKCSSEQCKRTLIEKDEKIRLLKSKLEKTKEKCDFQKQQLETLRSKSKEFDQIQVFLLERETFIAQIMEANIALNERIVKRQQQILRLDLKYHQALQEKQSLRQNYDETIGQLTKKLKSQYEEVQKISLLNEKLQTKMTIKKKNDKKSSRKTKQNNENFDKTNIKKGRKKSVSIQDNCNSQKFDHQFTPHDLNAIQQTKFLSETFEKTPTLSQEIQRALDNQPRDTLSNLSSQQTEQHENILISHLQQRIKYSEIEIDVLKKMKMDSSKIAKDNQCLKSQNRKLLNRISYLTRTFSRRDHSDSSLELSLSPK